MYWGKIEKNHYESGFSLIEVAIMLVILGILITPFLRLYNIQQIQEKVDLTEERLATIDSALLKYALREGRYPLPSDPSLSIAQANFGQETVSAIGPCAGGDNTVCWATGARDTDADPDAANDRVLIGSVPFAELQILEKFIVDGYGGRITYAVAEHMTGVTGLGNMEDDWGTVGVVNAEVGAPTSDRAHFVLVSHGEDRKGSRSMGGGVFSNCNAGHIDDENCDNDGNFTDNQTSISGGFERTQALVVGANYYDDYIDFRETALENIWTQEIGNFDVRSQITGNVLIGESPVIPNHTPDAKLTVGEGNIVTVALHANRLCNFDSGDVDSQCDDVHPIGSTPPSGGIDGNIFDPAIIAGTVNPVDYGDEGGGIHCEEITVSGTDYYDGMVGISNSDENCGINFFGGYTPPTCPDPATRLRGINADGSAFCDIP